MIKLVILKLVTRTLRLDINVHNFVSRVREVDREPAQPRSIGVKHGDPLSHVFTIQEGEGTVDR